MTPFEFWFPFWSRLPFSGDVAQSIAPLTNWFSPTVEVNYAGNRQIEADVVSNVASYGKQLGIVTDAVLALGHGNKAPALQRLQSVAHAIEARKQRYRDDMVARTRDDLQALQTSAPEALARLLEEFRPRAAKPVATAPAPTKPMVGRRRAS